MAKVSTNFDHTILGTNDNNNVFDSSTVIANRDGSLIERSEWVINALGGVQARFEQSASGTVEEDSIQQFTISIFDLDAGAVASGNIDVATGPISAVLSKSTAGGAFSISGITQPTFAKATGVVACSYRFLASEWQVGDMYRLVVGAIRATVDSEVVYIPDMIWSNIIKEAEELKTDVDAIRADYSIHTLFVIPEAVGSISADNTALQTELAKLGEVTTITQANLLAHSELASYSLCALGTGTTWTGSNLASLKAFPDLPILCVDKVTAAYLELGTAQSDATTKTDITAVTTIEGSMFGTGIHDITGLNAGANAVTTSATYHLLNMSDTDITESWYAYETTNANTHVALGGIFRQQNNGALGVDEEAGRVTSSMLFAGFCFDASALTTLGQDVYRLAALILIHERTIGLQGQAGTAGIGLFDLGGMSTEMKAEVQVEATDALEADNLDHFMQAAVDTNLQTTVANNSALGYALVISAVSNFDRTLHSLEAIAGAVADLGGLAFLGQVTTATSATEFAVLGLAGKGVNIFNDKYYCQIIEADNTGPEGEIKKISGYTTADGTFTTAAFGTAPDVGDYVLIYPESIYVIGQLSDAAVAMDTASDGTQTAIMLLRSILERIGQTPADSDDPVHAILGQRDATADTTAGTASVMAILNAVVAALGLVDGGNTGFEADGTGHSLYEILIAVEGTTTGAGTTATFVDTARTEGADYWNGNLIVALTGSAAGQVRTIVDDDGSDTLTVEPLLSAAPGTPIDYVILKQKGADWILGDNNASNAYNSSTVTSNADGSMIERQEYAQVQMSYGVVEIEADTGTTSTIIIDAAALTQGTDDWWKRALLISINGQNAGQTRPVVSFSQAADTVTVYPAFLNTPDVGDDFLLVSSWCPWVWDQLPDVSVSINAINASETNVFDLNDSISSYMINSLRIKCANPGANTVAVKLYELINNVSVNVQTFTIDTNNFAIHFSLVDMFGMAHLAGDDIQVTVQASAGGPYAITGQYQYAISKNG